MHCYVYNGCDCLPYLDHLSSWALYWGNRLWGYDMLEGYRDNLGFLSNQGEGFQIERWSSGELYLNELGCFATEQPFKRDHHTVRFCSKWVLWRSQHNWKHFPKEGPFKMHWMREDREHPISIPLMNQLPFRHAPYMLWPTHLSNCQLLLFFLFYDVQK